MAEHHDPHHSHGHPPHRPSAARINWRTSELSFWQKLKVASANNWIKIRKHQPCCGHPGEPGC